MRKLVCFFLGDRELAAPIDAVRETVALRPITRVFRTPRSIAGITNLRGEILAVLDPAVLLGLPACARGPSARIVIVEPEEREAAPPAGGARAEGPLRGSSGRRAGLLVDALGTIRDVDEELIGPVPPTVPPGVAAMLDGLVSLPERPIGLLDIGRILSAPELLPFTRDEGHSGDSAEVA